jgi:hypothetical protein
VIVLPSPEIAPANCGDPFKYALVARLRDVDVAAGVSGGSRRVYMLDALVPPLFAMFEVKLPCWPKTELASWFAKGVK